MDNKLKEKINGLCDEGDEYVNSKKFNEAFLKYKEALNLFPKEEYQSAFTLSVLLGLAEVYFRSGAFTQTIQVMTDAKMCDGGIGHPHLHLRKGQSHFELKHEREAADELARAYMMGGKEIFDDEDPKYFAFLKTKLKPPANGSW